MTKNLFIRELDAMKPIMLMDIITWSIIHYLEIINQNDLNIMVRDNDYIPFETKMDEIDYGIVIKQIYEPMQMFNELFWLF